MKAYARALAALVLVACTPICHATLITYSATNVVGATWRYDYSITNDTLADPLEEFTIFFELGLFSNLQISSSPLAWDSLVVEPDEFLASDGFFDSLALDLALDSGSTLAGFSVLFDFLGAGTPGSQRFEVVDPLSFGVLDAGFTQAQTPSTSVPEPTTLVLLTLGLLALPCARRRSSAQ